MSGGKVVAWRAEWDDDAWNEYSDDRDSEGWESWRSPPDRIVPLVLATDYAVLQSDLAAAIARAEAVERDAARYRGIRSVVLSERLDLVPPVPGEKTPDTFDAWIDAAIAAQQAEGA